MKELIEHKAYSLLDSEYVRVGLDYVILLNEEEYEGFNTHKKAVIKAFEILNERYRDTEYSIETYPEKTMAEKCETDDLFKLPPDGYDEDKKKKERSISIPEPLEYWYAFLEAPYGTPYFTDDFIKFNDVLFPEKENLEVYRFNDGFSNYFDEGKEWWGTGLWSVYDIKNKVMVIIAASLSD